MDLINKVWPTVFARRMKELWPLWLLLLPRPAANIRCYTDLAATRVTSSCSTGFITATQLLESVKCGVWVGWLQTVYSFSLTYTIRSK